MTELLLRQQFQFKTPAPTINVLHDITLIRKIIYTVQQLKFHFVNFAHSTIESMPNYWINLNYSNLWHRHHTIGMAYSKYSAVLQHTCSLKSLLLAYSAIERLKIWPINLIH